MRYLSLAEVIELHRRVVDQSGGASGLRDTGRLESAVAQPRISFWGAGSISFADREGRRVMLFPGAKPSVFRREQEIGPCGNGSIPDSERA